MFSDSYDFEQGFTFECEGADECLAFVDANTDRLDAYKEEYPSVYDWIENGMVC